MDPLPPPSKASLLRALLGRLGNAPLVGRDRELDAIRTELETARTAPHVLLLTGEPGIGKSRLLRETTALATDAGWRVLAGGAEEEVGAIPYLPWVQILRHLLHHGDQAVVERLFSSDAADIVTLVPELATHGELFSTPPTSETVLESDRRQLRLFDSVVRLFGRAAETAPLCITLDDVQWFDPASSALARYASLHGDGRLLLVMAGRSEELPRNPAVTRMLDEINRHRRLTTCPVSRLTPRDTATLLGSIVGHDDASLSESLYQQSDGNPFLIEEIVKGQAEGHDGEAPRGITALVARRLSRLSASGLHLLRIAALLGRRFSLDVAASVAELLPEQAATLLDEAVAASVLAPIRGDAAEGEFVHDCIREAILQNTNPLRRRALHIRIGEALEGQAERRLPQSIAALAFHFAAGGAFAPAAKYARMAGDQAMRQHAFADAASWFRQALDHMDHADKSPDASDRADTLARLAGAAAASADFATAIAAYQAAIDRSLADDDRVAAGRACRDLGGVYARSEDIANADAAYKRALTLLGDRGDSIDACNLLLRYGALHGMSTATYDLAGEVGQQALEMSSRLHHAELEASARLGLANTVMRSGNLAGGYAVLAPAIELSARLSNPDLAAEISAARANYAYWTGDLTGSEAATERRLALAMRSGDPYALRHVYLWQANIAYSRGRWTIAEALLAKADPILARLESPEPRAFQQHIRGLIAALTREVGRRWRGSRCTDDSPPFPCRRWVRRRARAGATVRRQRVRSLGASAI